VKSNDLSKLKSIQQAITDLRHDLADDLINEVITLEKEEDKLDLLNALLILPGHGRHQEIAKNLQDIGSPKSISFVESALDMGFKHLEYTASEDGVITKWYSHLLGSIGSSGAIEVIRKYTNDNNQEVAEEMRYRLTR